MRGKGGADKLHQTSEHTPGDRIERIKNFANEPKWKQTGYDAAGNLTQFPHTDDPNIEGRVTYDAWNRPAQIELADLWYRSGSQQFVEGVERQDPELMAAGQLRMQQGLTGVAIGGGIMAAPAFGAFGAGLASSLPSTSIAYAATSM